MAPHPLYRKRPKANAPEVAKIDVTQSVLSINEMLVYRLVFYRGPIGMKDLVSLVYCGVKDGGPLNAIQCVRSVIEHTNAKLIRFNQKIEGRGRRTKMYQVFEK